MRLTFFEAANSLYPAATINSFIAYLDFLLPYIRLHQTIVIQLLLRAYLPKMPFGRASKLVEVLSSEFCLRKCVRILVIIDRSTVGAIIG